MSEGTTLAPVGGSALPMAGVRKTGTGFPGSSGAVPRKVVDYSAGIVKMLENRLWQRDFRDTPLIQPDVTFYNEVVPPRGMLSTPVNAVTTKFVRAVSNKIRCPILCTSWVPDGRRVICGAHSGELTLWNGINLSFESALQAHDNPTRSMEWSHNGVWMVTTDDKGFVKYWQANLNNVHTFSAHNDSVRSSCFSPTDAKLATSSVDGTIRIFDFILSSEEFILRGHGADVMTVDWHPRKSLIASGSKDNQQPVKLWDPKAGHSVCTIHSHKAAVMSVKWNRNGNWLLTGSRDHLIKVYDIRAMKEMYTLKAHKKDVNVLAWHPVHETLFASGGSDGAILFWDVGKEREIGGMEAAHESFVWSLSWHPLGHFLVSGSNDTTSKFWCRNRPGDEMKDGYNSLVSALVLGEDETDEYALPGIGSHPYNNMSLPSSLSQRATTDAVTLPPPSFDKKHAKFPPPVSSDSGQGGKAAGPQDSGLAVLGADIIAETFGDWSKKQGSPQHPPFPPPDHQRQHMTQSFNREQPPGQFRPPPPGQIRGPPPPDRSVSTPPGRPPMQPRHVPNQFRPPPLSFHDRGPNREFGRHDFRSPPGGASPFSWQRADYSQRRPSQDDERQFHEPPRNPYVYRRQENEPQRDVRDPRMMSGDPRRGAQGRRQDWGRNPEPPSGPHQYSRPDWQEGQPGNQDKTGPPSMRPRDDDRPGPQRGPPEAGHSHRRTLLDLPGTGPPPRGPPEQGDGWSPMDRHPPQFHDHGPPPGDRRPPGPPPGDRRPPEHGPPTSRHNVPPDDRRPPEHGPPTSRPPGDRRPPEHGPPTSRPLGDRRPPEHGPPNSRHNLPDPRSQQMPPGEGHPDHAPNLPPRSEPVGGPRPGGDFNRPSPQHDVPPSERYFQNHPDGPMRPPLTPTTPPAPDQRFPPSQANPRPPFGMRGPPQNRPNFPPDQREFRPRNPQFRGQRPPFQPRPGTPPDPHRNIPPRPHQPSNDPRQLPHDQQQLPPRGGAHHDQRMPPRGGPHDQEMFSRPQREHQMPPRPGPPHSSDPHDQTVPPRPGPPHDQLRGSPLDQPIPPRPGPRQDQPGMHRGGPHDQVRPGPLHDQPDLHRGGPRDQAMPPRPGPPQDPPEMHRGGPRDQPIPPRPGPPQDQPGMHRGGPHDQPRPGPLHDQPEMHRGGPRDQPIPPRPGPPHDQPRMHRGAPHDQPMPPRSGPPQDQPGMHRGGPRDQPMPPRPGPPHDQPGRGAPHDQPMPPRPGPPQDQPGMHRGDQPMPPRPGPPQDQHRGQHESRRDAQRPPPFGQPPHDFRSHSGDHGPPPHFRQHGPPHHEEGWQVRDPRGGTRVPGDPRDRGKDGRRDQLPPKKRPRMSQE